MGKIKLLVLFTFISFFSYGQLRPSNLPTVNSPQSFYVLKGVRDTMKMFIPTDTFPALYPTLILHTSGKFFFSNGNGGFWREFAAQGSAINGNGFVKASGATISYDNSTYFPSPTGTTSQYIRGNGSLATFPSLDFVPTSRTITSLGVPYSLSTNITLPPPTPNQIGTYTQAQIDSAIAANAKTYNFQSVTDGANNNVTTNDVKISNGSSDIIKLTKISNGPPTDVAGRVTLSSSYNDHYTHYGSDGIYYSRYGNGANFGWPYKTTTSRTLALSVNNIFADTLGNINITGLADSIQTAVALAGKISKDSLKLRASNDTLFVDVGGQVVSFVKVITDTTNQASINTALTGKVSYVTVATYAAMIALGTPSVMTTYKVLNDENKSGTNTEYHWWPDGHRNWVITTDDN